MTSALHPSPRRIALASAAHADHPMSWFIMTCTILGMVLAAADQTIVGAAMPRIISDLSGFDQYAWVTTAYLLGATVTMPLYGKLADLYEAKWVFLFGVVLFTAASALCGLAHSMTTLIAFRALQGIGSGALSPVGVVIMSAFVTPERRNAMQGSAGGIVLVATVAGPIIGGWLTDHWSWRWVFFINVPLGLFVAVGLAVVLPRLRLRHGQSRIDYSGAALLTLAAVPLLLVASAPSKERAAISASWVVPLLVFGLVMLAVFVVHELRHPEPILDPRLLVRRGFAVTASATTLLSAVTFAGLVYIPLYIQGVLAHSALGGGLVLAPLMLSSVSGRLLINWLRTHHGRGAAIAIGCLGLIVAGVGLLTLLTPSSSSAQVVVAMVLLGTGLGAGNMLIFAAALSIFARVQFGQATGTLLFLRSLGGTVITGALGGVLASRFAADVGGDLPRQARWLLHSRFATLLETPRLLLGRANEATQSGHAILYAMRAALASSLHDVFLITLALSVVALALLVVFPLRLSRQAEEEALAAAESGVAAIGDVALTQRDLADTPRATQACTVWDLMCHILYWRHGAVRFATQGAPTLRSFNGFEDTVALPTSLRDPALAAAFERAWPLARARTPLDRYRAESIVTLLWQTRDVAGDVAVCGGTGDGLALLLALMTRELSLPGTVYYYDGVLEPAERYDANADTEPLRELITRHDLDGVLVDQTGRFLIQLPLAESRQRFRLIHIDTDTLVGTNTCLVRLLPLASVDAAVIIGHYHNSRDGARRVTQEHARRLGVALHAGPLPQVHFFVPETPPDAAEAETDWPALDTGDPYRDFLRWVGRELAGCDATSDSALDRHIAQAIARFALPERADLYIDRFITALNG